MADPPARRYRKPMTTQGGEMTRTEADVTETNAAFGYAPSTAIDVGVKRFVDWYRDFYGV